MKLNKLNMPFWGLCNDCNENKEITHMLHDGILFFDEGMINFNMDTAQKDGISRFLCYDCALVRSI